MLIDDILERKNFNEILDFSKICEAPNDERILKDVLKDCIHIDVSNIAKYYGKEEFMGDSIKHLRENVANMAPPFRTMWLECRYPMADRLKKVIIERIGVVLLYTRVQNAGWFCRSIVFARITNEKTLYSRIICFGAFGIDVDENGQIGNDFRYRAGNMADDYADVILYDFMLFAGVSISFMHCKNVKLIDNEILIKLQKARQKRNKLPLVKHYTLEISPVKKLLREQGNIEKTGIKQALHICRGHFKDYRDGRGLFGKYQGLYWWEDQVRGNIENGKIIKDYKVNPAV
jgi:hypothetical protein